MQDYWLPTPFASFPFTSPPVRHRVPSQSDSALPKVISPHASKGSNLGAAIGKHLDLIWVNTASYLCNVDCVTNTDRVVLRQ